MMCFVFVVAWRFETDVELGDENTPKEICRVFGKKDFGVLGAFFEEFFDVSNGAYGGLVEIFAKGRTLDDVR
jgi:hypothetical protein